MLDVVWAVLRSTPTGLHKHGHNVMLYKDDIPNVEVGVQVSGPFDPAGDVVPSHLPGGLAATATHTGPMSLIGDTHHAIVEWCKESGHRLDGRRWEIYGDPDPSSGEFAVEVYWSLLSPSRD
jgi:effector-binding domain-containing protein